LITIVVLLIAMFVLVFPVKIAAGWVQAGRTGFGSCLVAVIFAGVCQAILGSFFGRGSVTGVLVALLVTPLPYMLVLDTTYVKGMIIAIVQLLLLLLAVFVLAGLGLVL
jgi:hypothetical protein